MSHVDVYWVSRDLSKVFKVANVFWDYMLYKKDETLIDYRRKVFK